MKSSVGIGALVLYAMLCCSCHLFGGPSAGVAHKGVEYKAGAMKMNIKGDSYLNLHQDRAHPVYLCIYQLKEPNWFIQTVAGNGGIENLMKCGRLDPSVTIAKRLVVQPGQELVENGDMAEGTRYLGIVAGYYNMQEDNVARLYEINQSHLSMTLELGPMGIKNLKVK